MLTLAEGAGAVLKVSVPLGVLGAGVVGSDVLGVGEVGGGVLGVGVGVGVLGVGVGVGLVEGAGEPLGEPAGDDRVGLDEG